MKIMLIILMVAALIAVPSLAAAEAEQEVGATPPISQPVVREGTVAVNLADALQLGTTTSEVDAESLLVSAGVAPRNGWMADYPVTPDIASELREAVGDAADAGSITLGKEQALEAYDSVMEGFGLALKYDAGDGSYEESATVPDNTVINNYYYSEGPPVVTYYAPPPEYTYLYSWVPYPFWWWDFWFPGFYVLVDFNRVIVIGGHVHAVSNHFFDRKSHSFRRVSPAHRFDGHDGSIAGRDRVIGPAGTRAGADMAVTNRGKRPHVRGSGANTPYGGRAAISPPQTPTRNVERSRPLNRSYKYRGSNYRATTSNAPYGGERTINVPRTYSGPSAPRVSGGGTSGATSGVREFSVPGRSGRMFSPPASRGFSGGSFRPGVGRFNGAFGGMRGR
jgi:hypothetical protein